MSGFEMINAERARQIYSEGWRAEHDDSHRNGELFHAAQCYEDAGDTHPDFQVDPPPTGWPYDKQRWKPSQRRIRNYVKAGSLYRAEAERLRRRGMHIRAGIMETHAKRCAETIDQITHKESAAH